MSFIEKSSVLKNLLESYMENHPEIFEWGVHTKEELDEDTLSLKAHQ